MHNRPGFTELQYAFTRHIRRPDAAPPPSDVEDRRVGIYRELFFNNVEGFISTAFPVLRQLYEDDDWQALVRNYFASHLAHTPLFPQLPREFLDYLEHERSGHPQDPPFMWELAHYEWVEWALTIDTTEIGLDGVDPDGDLLAGVPVLSPLAWPLAYRFPVHRIGPDFRPLEEPEQPVYLVVYRNREDDIGFLEVNPVTARMLQYLGEGRGLTGRELLTVIAGELEHPDPDVVIAGGLHALDDLRARDIVLGVTDKS